MSLTTHISIQLMAASTLVAKFAAAVDFARRAPRPSAEGTENADGTHAAVNADSVQMHRLGKIMGEQGCEREGLQAVGETYGKAPAFPQVIFAMGEKMGRPAVLASPWLGPAGAR